MAFFGCCRLCYYNRGFHIQTPGWHSWRHTRVHTSDTVDPAVNMTFGKVCGVWQPWPKFCSDEIGNPTSHYSVWRLGYRWGFLDMPLEANTGKKKKKTLQQELETSGEQQVLDWNSFMLHKKKSERIIIQLSCLPGIGRKPTLSAGEIDGCLLWEYRWNRENKVKIQYRTIVSIYIYIWVPRWHSG